jgi:hypothetical protein
LKPSLACYSFHKSKKNDKQKAVTVAIILAPGSKGRLSVQTHSIKQTLGEDGDSRVLKMLNNK